MLDARKLKFFKLPKHIACRVQLIYNSLTILERVRPELQEVSILYEQTKCPIFLSPLSGLPICEKKSTLRDFFSPLTATVKERLFFFFKIAPHIVFPLCSPVTILSPLSCISLSLLSVPPLSLVLCWLLIMKGLVLGCVPEKEERNMTC